MLKMMDPDNLPKFVYLHNNYKYRLKLGFYAAPSNPKIFSTAVQDELNKLKFTYCSDLNGLVMGFGKIKSNELIQADVRHCINVVVNVDVYIFRPPVGSIIKAVVNQTSENHVSCLVHNLFNVSIVRPEHQPYNKWPGSKIKKDDKINVKVLSFDLTKKLPHITGDIVGNKYTDDEPDNYSEKCSSSTKESVSKSIKHIEKKDTDSSSKLLSSDSESFDDVDSPITCSKTFENQLTKTLLLNQTTNSKHIKGPLFSSTPVSSSEHSVNNINLIRNKQLQQLHKHLAKNAEKEKSLDYVKSEIKLNLPATSIISNDNSDSINKINRQRSLQSDSGISDDDRKQINFPIQNAFSNTPGTSTKTNEKHQSSNKIIGSVLHSSSQKNKIKHETNVSKHNLSFDFNTDHTSDDDDEKKSVYTQHVNDMINSDEDKSVYNQHIQDLKNSDEEMFYNCKSTNEPKIKESTTLRLNTKNIQKSNVPQNKYVENCRKKIVKEHSNNILSMMSYSESSSENEKLPIKEINHQSNLSKKIEKNTIDISSGSKVDIINTQCISSSDDEVYTKCRQNISKKLDTKLLTEQTKSQQIFTSDNENNTSISFHNTISEILKVIDNTNNCNVNNNDNNILLEIKKMCNKTKQVKTNSTLETLQCSNEEKKSSIIGHNIGEDTSSDDEMNILLSKKMSKKPEQVNEKESTSKFSLSSTKKKKVTPNVISEKNKKNENIGYKFEEDTSIDDEINLLFNKKRPKQVKTNSTLETLKCSYDEKKTSPNFFIDNSQNEIIGHNIEEATSSDNEINLVLSNEMLEKEKAKNVIKTSSILESSIGSNTKKKLTPNLNSKKNKKNKKIEYDIEDSDSEDEMNVFFSKKISKKLNQANEKESTLKASLCSNEKEKVTPNLINDKNKQNKNIECYSEEDTSNDNEVNLLFNQKNKITPNLVSEENKKNENIEHNLEKDSSSDNEINLVLSNEMLEKEKAKNVIKTSSTLESSIGSNTKKKLTPNLNSKKKKKNEKIEYDIEDSDSEDEMNVFFSKKISKKLNQANEKESTLKASLCSDKKEKVTPNLINDKNKQNKNIGCYSEEDTSNDDEVNLLFNQKNKITPNLVSEENKKNENIEHNLEKDSSSDNEINLVLSNEMLEKEKAKNVIKTSSTLESSIGSNTKKKLTPNLNSKKKKKNEKIEYDIEDSDSEDEMNVFFSKKISKKLNQANEKESTLKASLCSDKKEKVTPNLINDKNKQNKNIGCYSEEDTSNDDEVNLLFNKKNKITPNLVSEENKKNENIEHNLEKDSSSDNEINLVLSNEMLEKEKAKNVNKTSSTLESSIGSNTKKKLTPNLNSKKNKKNEKIEYDIEDSDSEDEMNVFFSKKISKKLNQANEKESTLKASLCSDKKEKVTPNLINDKNKQNKNIGCYSEEDTSNDDEVNLLFNQKNKITPNLVSEENKKNENIEHNLEKDSSSDNEINLVLSNEMLEKEKAKNVNKTSSTLESSIGSNTKKKLTPNLNNKKNKKNEKIEYDIEDSDSEDEMNVFFSKKISKKLNQANEKESTLKASLCSDKKEKVTPNLINDKNKQNKNIGCYSEEDTSNDDEVNLLFNKKNKITPNLVSEENKNENIEHNLEDSCSDNDVDLILSNKPLKKVNKPSSVLESSIGSNKKKKLTQNLNNEKNKKKEIIKHILSNNDKVKCTSLKSNINDEYKIKSPKKSNKIPTSVLNLNENTCTVLKKDISNPFIKLYTQNVKSSSSDDEASINLSKSKNIINHSSKKKYSSLLKDINKKEDIIKEVLTSIKHKNKKQKQMLPVKHINLKSKDCDSPVKIKKLKKEESIVSTKNKKSVLDKLNNPIDKLKPNTMFQNIYLKDSQLQPKLNPTDSTDDEIDVIKKILRKKQKLNKINNQKIELPELSMKNDIASKSNNLCEISEKLNKKLKSKNVSTAITNELINNIKTKKKRPKEIKDLLLDNITTSLDDSSISHVLSKKKKKDHNATIKIDDVSKDTMFYGDLSKVKKKKKKNKHNEDIKLSDLTVKNNTNQYNSSIKFEQQNTQMQKDTFMDITKKKEKKKIIKSDPTRLDTQNIITDKSKLNDKLPNKHIVNRQRKKGSNKKTVKLLTKNQIQTFLLSQNNDTLDNLYKSLSCNKLVL